VRLVVKLGGTLLDEDSSRHRIVGELAALARSRGDLSMVVVHGGGKQMTRFLAERGVESRFVGGLRVTTPEVVDAVLKVFTGTVNRSLVAAFAAAGIPAVGVCGIDACLVEAEQLKPELGAVGRPVRSNPALLETLLAGGFLPVVACVAGDRQGRIYNVNADQMAVAVAAGFHADRLVFLTDVNGVQGADGRVLRELDAVLSRRLIEDGVATGGMQAKLDAALDALRQEIAQVMIAPGAETSVIGRLLSGEPIGTTLVR
jgi:acetylglutamate kinase